MQSLSDQTQVILNLIRDFLGSKRLFGSTFVYDGMDYMRVVTHEMRSLKDIMHMFGVSIYWHN